MEAAYEPAVVWDVDLVLVPQNLAHLLQASSKVIFCCCELHGVLILAFGFPGVRGYHMLRLLKL